VAAGTWIAGTDATWPKLSLGAPSLCDVAHRVRLEVLQLVAGLAQRQPVAQVEPKSRVCREWLDVVRMEVAAACISAAPAGVSVARKDSSAPRRVFGATADRVVERRHAALPPRIGRPRRRPQPRCAGIHNGPLRRRFDVPDSELVSEPLRAHQAPRTIWMTTAFERGRLTRLEKVIRTRVLYTTARKAGAVPTVCATPVIPEFGTRSPFLAARALMNAGSGALDIFIEGHAGPFCGDFHCAFGGLSHER
jgi:hypothetical protein